MASTYKGALLVHRDGQRQHRVERSLMATVRELGGTRSSMPQVYRMLRGEAAWWYDWTLHADDRDRLGLPPVEDCRGYAWKSRPKEVIAIDTCGGLHVFRSLYGARKAIGCGKKELWMHVHHGRRLKGWTILSVDGKEVAPADFAQ